MKKTGLIAITVMLLLAANAKAQFTQDKAKVEAMFKIEAGYMPFVSNLGDKGDNGYYIDDMRHIANANVIGGVNICQDFFVGVGAGYGYVAKPDDFGEGWHSFLGFVDFDYRPLDVEWAPMAGAKVGVSYLMADSPYENTLKPYAEINAGVNWFFNYVYRNMERNYASVYLTVGFAYTQQTTFIPVRVGLRF